MTYRPDCSTSLPDPEDHCHEPGHCFAAPAVVVRGRAYCTPHAEGWLVHSLYEAEDAARERGFRGLHPPPRQEREIAVKAGMV